MTTASSVQSVQVASTNNGRSLSRLHALLAIQSIVVILVSLNRLGSWTLGYVHPNQFLRWVDLINMLPLPLASIVGYYLVKKWVERPGPAFDGRAHLLLGLTFAIGLFLLGAGYGDHEVTNYLHARVCTPDDGSDLCRILIFNDDEFSHWVFFTGFILLNVVLMLLQTLFPHPAPVPGRDRALLLANALFIGAGIFANLAFEVIGLDQWVVAALAVLSLVLWRRNGPQPLLIYYAAAYNLGLVATFIYKLTH